MDRVTEPDDPRRCTASDKNEQCWRIAAPGCDRCPRHQGSDKLEPQLIRQYKLTDARLRRRMEEKAGVANAKSLAEEIYLTRILIEDLMNSAKTDTDRLANCGAYNQLAMTLERLIKTSHQMEQSLNMLLSKTTIVVLGQDIVRILIEELSGVPQYETRIDRITERMLEKIEHATNKPEE